MVLHRAPEPRRRVAACRPARRGGARVSRGAVDAATRRPAAVRPLANAAGTRAHQRRVARRAAVRARMAGRDGSADDREFISQRARSSGPEFASSVAGGLMRGHDGQAGSNRFGDKSLLMTALRVAGRALPGDYARTFIYLNLIYK